MQIKKFIAPTLKEASQQMKDELGSNAIILGSRVIEPDGRLLQKRMFELTAGVEAEDQAELIEAEKFDEKVTSSNNFNDELIKLSKKIYSEKNILQENLPGKVKTDTPVKLSGSTRTTEEIVELIKDKLIDLEIMSPVVNSIVDQISRYKNFLHESNIDGYILSTIASMIPTYNFEVHKGDKPKIVTLVGPTGIGKTTCIAKLALISKILHNLDIGLISIDTYRLGALDQLKIFSEISTIEMKVAYEPSELRKLVESFKKKDLIFIDTIGRSQKNINSLLKMKEFLSAVKAEETYLVLNSTASTKNLFDVAEKFKIFNYKSLIFTKIDEAVTYGNILNVIAKFNVPVSFLTNGQVIPDDIISADPEYISNMIYTGKISK